MRRVVGRTLMASAAVGALLTGCGAPSVAGPEADLPPPGLRIGTVANLALAAPLVGLAEHVAMRGLASGVTFVPANSPDEIRANLTSGRVDVATMPTTVAATLANGGVGVQLLGVVDAELLKVVGPVGSAGWGALRGQTIHLPFRGDFADLTFGLLAEQNGLAPGRDVTLAYGTALPELVSGFVAGRIRYAVLPEQFATVARSQATAAGHGTVEVLDLAMQWRAGTGNASLPGSAIVIRGELAEQRPELVAELRLRFAQACEEVVRDPARAAGELGRLARVPPELVSAVLADLSPRFVDASAARSEIEAMLRRFTEREPRSTGGRLPDAAFYGT